MAIAIHGIEGAESYDTCTDDSSGVYDYGLVLEDNIDDDDLTYGLALDDIDDFGAELMEAFDALDARNRAHTHKDWNRRTEFGK